MKISNLETYVAQLKAESKVNEDSYKSAKDVTEQNILAKSQLENQLRVEQSKS